MTSSLMTPQTHPNHQTIGRLFTSWNGNIYYCDSYDPQFGFWMTNVMDERDRRNVSERAPRATYHDFRGVWSPEDIQDGMAPLVVDLKCAPFTPRRVSAAEARNMHWYQPLFLEDFHANEAARRATVASQAREKA